jgi:putative endonuclease
VLGSVLGSATAQRLAADFGALRRRLRSDAHRVHPAPGPVHDAPSAGVLPPERARGREALPGAARTYAARADAVPLASRLVRGLRRAAAWHAPRLALRLFEPTPAELGPLGESLAARHLACAGLRVVARNVRRPESELDLVATRGPELIAVEVKTSRVFLDRPLGALPHRPAGRVDPRRRARLARAAAGLAQASGRVPRVDVVEVWIAGPRRRPSLAWHPGGAAGEEARA